MALPSELPDVSAEVALQEATINLSKVSHVIDSLKKSIDEERVLYIKERMKKNWPITMANMTKNHRKEAIKETVNLLTNRMEEGIDLVNGTDISNNKHASVPLFESGIRPVKHSIPPINLPKEERIPPYTTWVFLDRNQKMTEDDTVVGRRRIYYDRKNGYEALICSDSEEEMVDEEEDKKEFVEAEDKIIRMTIEEFGSSDVVYDSLAQRMSIEPCEVKARYEALVSQQNAIESSNSGHTDLNMCWSMDKDLEAAQDSFDHLFCRRCLSFDCKLHGCSQELIFPAKKQRPWSGEDEDSIPCGPHCYLKVPKLDGNAGTSPIQLDIEQKTARPSDASEILVSREKDGSKSNHASSNSKNVSESSDSEFKTIHDATSTHTSPSTLKDISVTESEPHHRNSKSITNDVTVSMKRRQQNIVSESDFIGFGSEEVNGSSPKLDSSFPIGDQRTTGTDDTQKENEFGDEGTSKEVADFESWKTFEKSLYDKGIEIYGRNSCLIARNVMGGLKTCLEVHNALKHFEIKLSSELRNSQHNGCNTESNKGLAQIGSKFMGRKGKTSRSKYTRKSAVFHYMRKHISDNGEFPCHQYNPCGCQSSCGDDCPCLASETFCEKYCGCPRTCKIRFKGCNCTKSHCRSRHCPCFIANRECDPDVCRNCWISCGDGTRETPVQNGANYECKNMNLLLRQKERVLLGTSDVSGWGAFLQNDLAKNEYIGEYTGELISHHEADKRGKAYDRRNSSYLFDLNNEYVIDAYRKGDKLKFANHSANPNSNAKVMMVRGDHRLGIYAKEKISAGEELFIDYRYEADQAPAWAKKPGESCSNGEHRTGWAKKSACR